jgi:hypothetical protein
MLLHFSLEEDDRWPEAASKQGATVIGSESAIRMKPGRGIKYPKQPPAATRQKS